MHRHVVILAGGSGTRLWPASREKIPKQFLDLGEGQSLFQKTLGRALALKLGGRILVVTHLDQGREIERQCTSLLEEARGEPEAELSVDGRIVILSEPEAKNTAPAVAYACSLLEKTGGPGGIDGAEDSVLVLPADHRIEPLEAFSRDVERAFELAEAGYLVTFGIEPERPETGYGYIEAGEALGSGRRVRRFKEKPDAATAERFLASGDHYWNSGMFAFRLDVFKRELIACSPEVSRPFADLPPLPEEPGRGPVTVPADSPLLKAAYEAVPSISLDYALMEKSRRCAMVGATFNWSDIGSWDEVARLYGSRNLQGAQPPSSNMQAAKPPSSSEPVFRRESEGNFVYSDLPVALAGVEDLLVVVKNGVVLIARKGRSQLVKEIVAEIRASGREELL